MGDVIKGIGKVIGTAAPLAGLIPGIGPLAAAGIGAGAKVLGGGGGKGAVEGAAEGGLGGLANKLGAFDTNNKFDPGKAIGAAGSVMNVIGQGQQRKSATDYNNAQINQRNALMSKILAPSNYGVPNMNAQSSGTPAGGSGGSVGY